MKRAMFTAALFASAAAMAAPPRSPAPRRETPPRIVAEVVSTDPVKRTLTVRDARRHDEPPASDPAAGPRGEPITLSVSAPAAGPLARYKAGDRVELTCGPAPDTAAPAPATEATPGPPATGTGAQPGTGTTGVGTTGTGISGTGTPAPGKTEEEAGEWLRRHCAVVTAVAAAPRPGPM
jgi:hypothetical protein